MRTFTLSLFAAAFVLVATQAATAQVGPYCFTDNFGYVWDIEPDGPTDILFGSTTNIYPQEAPIIGGRGQSNQTIRHHSLTTVNPDLANDPSCGDGAGGSDWFTYNGTVTGNSTPFGYTGDWVNSCGSSGTFSGTIFAGTCPFDAPRWNDAEPLPGTPMSAVSLDAPVEEERGAGAVYCFTDTFGYEWELFPEGPIGQPSGIIVGDFSDAGIPKEVAGGRGRTISRVRHHVLTAINPTYNPNSSSGTDGTTNWFVYNGNVTGNSEPFGLVGDWFNAAGSFGTFSGTFVSGFCPARGVETGEVALGGPNAPQMSEQDELAAAAAIAALGVSVHPNPAVDEARISYSLDASAEVRLVVYDMLGRQVATLVDGTQEAGAHTAAFDARGMASGIYVYHLVAGEQTVAGQISLTR